jgi:large subunit ribosomal protein L4
MKVKVLTIEGKDTGREVSLPSDFFAVEPNDHAIYLDVKQHLANLRQGTHKSKERAEIAGSTKKLRKQKGGGGARIGDIKSPLLRGGGTVFGPRPRNYGFKLNKKVKDLARKSAFTHKATQEAIVVVEDPKFDAPKTKAFVSILSSLGATSKALFVQSENSDRNLYVSARNIPYAKVSTVDKLNTYDILNCNKLILSESSLKYFTK